MCRKKFKNDLNLNNGILVYCACADPLYKGMEQHQSCSSSGGVALNIHYCVLRMRRSTV